MTNKYALKAENFVISHPEMPASEGQMRQIDKLIRLDGMSVADGNTAIDYRAKVVTRLQADKLIKWIVRHQAENAVTQATTALATRRTPKSAIKRVDGGWFVPDDCSRKLGAIASKRLIAVSA